MLKNQIKNNNLTILLAEDDLDDQELLAEAFAGIDPSIELVSFTTGKKIINYLEDLDADTIPKLIILDYNIPEMNGAEILRHLEAKERYQSVIKLVWSTSNSSYYENTCISSGARAYLVKPSNINALSDMAKTMLSYIGSQD